MNDFYSRQELLSDSLQYLRTVRDQYRTGFPLSLLQPQKVLQRGLFVYLEKESENRCAEAQHLELLEKAIVKGLELEFSKQALLRIPSAIRDLPRPNRSRRPEGRRTHRRQTRPGGVECAGTLITCRRFSICRPCEYPCRTYLSCRSHLVRRISDSKRWILGTEQFKGNGT